MTSVNQAIAVTLLAGSCLGQASAANQHVTEVFDRWRWLQYWEDATDLGAKYKEGARLQVLLFWRTDETVDSMGFCSLSLGVCQFYPSVSSIWNHSEMVIAPGGSLQSAFRKFSAEAFEQNSSPLYRTVPRSPAPKEGEYRTEPTTITLPKLDPPDAILQRRARPRSEIEGLARSLGCGPGIEGCKLHLLIPFYSDHDLWVPVFVECVRECGEGQRSPAILLPKLTEGRWWVGATNFNKNPDYVKRARGKIEKALMLEVGR